jgi:SAM-dependent methyltransferase
MSARADGSCYETNLNRRADRVAAAAIVARVRLYDDLTPWYRLVDPPQDHEGEAAVYARALTSALAGTGHTLLELGAGAGHNALFMKRRFRCTLTDISPAMRALSRELNPECEHLAGDMRTLRLDRQFDAVFVHDAVCYMTTARDLEQAVATAFAHTRPGGAALFAPDYVRERFRETSTLLTADDGPRSLRGVEWAWDPDPNDTRYTVEYTFLLRDGLDVGAAVDRHIEGLFSIDEWTGILESAGYEVSMIERPLDDDDQTDRVFVCRRPGR